MRVLEQQRNRVHLVPMKKTPMITVYKLKGFKNSLERYILKSAPTFFITFFSFTQWLQLFILQSTFILLTLPTKSSKSIGINRNKVEYSQLITASKDWLLKEHNSTYWTVPQLKKILTKLKEKAGQFKSMAILHQGRVLRILKEGLKMVIVKGQLTE